MEKLSTKPNSKKLMDSMMVDTALMRERLSETLLSIRQVKASLDSRISRPARTKETNEQTAIAPVATTGSMNANPKQRAHPTPTPTATNPRTILPSCWQSCTNQTHPVPAAPMHAST